MRSSEGQRAIESERGVERREKGEGRSRGKRKWGQGNERGGDAEDDYLI
jgi:hypothetical protein